MKVLAPSFCFKLKIPVYKQGRPFSCLFSVSSKYVNSIFVPYIPAVPKMGIYYSEMLDNSANLFGCSALNHKKYCILNKQYTKEQYEELLPKIIQHMKQTGEWGEFFPVSISPFAYNETVANEYYPLSKIEALEKGFKWRDDDRENVYKGPECKIPDDIKDVDSDIMKKILVCEQSGKPYKIIDAELKFYKKLNVPVPRISPHQRHLERIALRNPRRLFERKCSKCGVDLKSTYDSLRPEKVYCEDCYKAVVY